MWLLQRPSVSIVAIGALLLSACSMQAPKPTLSVERTQLLREDAGPAQVGSFTAGKDAHEQGIGMRGSSMKSPYGSYSNYLREALIQDLKEAQRLKTDSNVEISAELLSNDMHVAGISTNSGEMSAHFVIKRGGEIRYDATKSVNLSWDSSFIGAIALPRAMEKYPELVGKLLRELYVDKAFQEATKP